MSRTNLPHHCEDCPSQGQGIFCELERAAQDDLSEHKIVNKFKKGQTLFVEGKPPYGLYCISTGNVKLTKTNSEGKESIVRIASPGDVLGHRSIFTDSHYSATATAVDETVVCFVDKKYILDLVRENPTVSFKLMSQLSSSLGASENLVASFAQKNVRERLAELLLLLKESHGEKHTGRTKTQY